MSTFASRFRMWRTEFVLLATVCCCLSASRAATIEGTVPSGDFDLSGALPDGWQAGRILFVLCRQPDQRRYELLLDRGKPEFAYVAGTVHEALGSFATAAPASGAAEFVLQRRGWEWRLLIGRHLLGIAYDERLSEGTAAVDGTGVTVDPDAFRWQEVDAILFTDDFMRGPDEEGEWEPVAGNGWRYTGLAGEQSKTELTANPFALRVTADGPALTVAGYPFWSDYSFAVSLRCDDAGTIGAVVDYQDERNYILVKWDSAAAPDPMGLRLVEVRDGSEIELARHPAGGGHRPRQWYRLTITCEGPRITVILDGVRLCDVECRDFLRGKVGLFAEKTAGVFFDDAEVRSLTSFTERFTQAVPGKWRSDGAGWRIEPAVAGGAVVAGTGSFVTGSSQWTDYRVSATVTPAAEGVEGIGACRQENGDGYRLLWAPGQRDNVTLVCVTGGKAEILARGGFPREAGAPATLSLDIDDDYLSGAVQGTRVVEAVDSTFTTGKISLIAADTSRVQGRPGARFADVEMRTGLHIHRRATLTTQYTREVQTMGEWSTPAGQWVSDDRGFRHKVEFFGGVIVRFPLPELLPRTHFVVSLAPAAGKEPTYALEVSTGDTPWPVRLTLRRGNQVLATGMITSAAPEDNPVEFRRRGNMIYVRAGHLGPEGSRIVLKADVSNPHRGTP